MSFSILIPKIVVRPTKLVDKKSGNFRDEQLVMIQHPDQFTPVQGSVLLDGDQKPYEIGTYELGADSITPGEYGRAQFRLVIGKRVDAAAKKAA